MKKPVILVWCFVCLAPAIFSGCKKEEGGVKAKVVLKLAHSLDVTHPVHKAMEYMAEKVKEKSGGQMQIQIFPSEQLGTEKENIESLQLGYLAMTKTSTAVMEGFVPRMKIFGIPYLFRDSEHYWKVLNGPIGKELLLAGQSKGLRGLCYYDAGARSFYAKKEIDSPADLVGLKIRVMNSAMCIEMIKAMGGSPTPIPWGELYTALEQGVVDAAENNPPSYRTSRHYEVCKFYTLDEHARLPDILMISVKVWNGLSPEFQQILQEAVDESVEYQRKIWAEAEKEDLKIVEDAGVKVIYPDKKPFEESVQSMWDAYKGTEIGELMKQIQEVK
jgi:tripartite ATP-independent transporter DctP family solute receptor